MLACLLPEAQQPRGMGFHVIFAAVVGELPPRGPVFGNCKYVSWQFHPLPAASGAVCLDGSPAGFYYGRAFGPTFQKSWVLYFEGGGWCVSAEDCALRARSSRGSSRTWPVNGTTFGQLLNKCCYCTPFCRFHRVMIKSCDGHSFAGDAVIPPPSTSPIRRLSRASRHDRPKLDQGSADALSGLSTQALLPLHSAGRAILRATMDVLTRELGLVDAADVLVIGCSAGGLAALLHAESIRTALLAAGGRPRRFKVASLAGLFFPDQGGPASVGPASSPFVAQMARAAALGRMTFSPTCVSRWPRGEAWRCLLSTEPVKALPSDLPAFVIQSRLDLWQTSCVLTAAPSRFSELACAQSASQGGEWTKCLAGFKPLSYSLGGKGQSACTQRQWARLREFENANDRAIAQATSVLRRPGWGSWVHSCHDHCPGCDMLLHAGARPATGWRSANDSVNMREALFKWFWDCATSRETTATRICKARDWSNPGRADPAMHTYTGCPNKGVLQALASQGDAGAAKTLAECQQECGVPEKLAHDIGKRVALSIHKMGWSAD